MRVSCFQKKFFTPSIIVRNAWYHEVMLTSHILRTSRPQFKNIAAILIIIFLSLAAWEASIFIIFVGGRGENLVEMVMFSVQVISNKLRWNSVYGYLYSYTSAVFHHMISIMLQWIAYFCSSSLVSDCNFSIYKWKDSSAELGLATHTCINSTVPSVISHNAPFVTEMCTRVHISVTKWCVVEYFYVGILRWVITMGDVGHR